jgi:hypothetical protein
MNKKMVKGEIYKLSSRFREEYSQNCYNHPFIYWEEKSADYTGIMLTTSDNPIYKNIELKQTFFKEDLKLHLANQKKNQYPMLLRYIY